MRYRHVKKTKSDRERMIRQYERLKVKLQEKGLI